jgi:hypothetical protein
MALLTAPIGQNAIYHRLNTNSKLMDIAICKACKNVSLGVENTMLI